MISIHAFDLSGFAKGLVMEANEQTLLESVATRCGFQEDGEGGGFELWTLTKAIAGHPCGSTVTRATILRALCPSKYGATTVQPSPDFQHVEKP